MSIKLNPCEACIKKYQSGNCDIRNVSDCCYSTLAAFAGETSMNAVRNGSESDDKGLENCKKCVSQFISKMGRTPCDLRVEPPPLWNRTPHFFPEMLSQTSDYDLAKKSCIGRCDETNFPNECKINCETDYDAVEKYDRIDHHANNAQHNTRSTSSSDETSSRNRLETIFLAVVVIFLVLMFLKTFFIK
jgi:hypothetical protein